MPITNQAIDLFHAINMILLNFSHPITQEQLATVRSITKEADIEVRSVPVQFDTQLPFVPQIQKLVDSCGLSSSEWQSLPILINPPAFNFIAVGLMAELQGRMGYFAPIIRLRPIQNALPPRYEIAEILHLQQIRDEARKRRE